MQLNAAVIMSVRANSACKLLSLGQQISLATGHASFLSPRNEMPLLVKNSGPFDSASMHQPTISSPINTSARQTIFDATDADMSIKDNDSTLLSLFLLSLPQFLALSLSPLLDNIM